MRKVAFINEKGGTCKTTLCVNVAARLAARGRRVLVADLDTQGHAGKSLGVDVRRLARALEGALPGRASTPEAEWPVYCREVAERVEELL